MPAPRPRIDRHRRHPRPSARGHVRTALVLSALLAGCGGGGGDGSGGLLGGTPDAVPGDALDDAGGDPDGGFGDGLDGGFGGDLAGGLGDDFDGGPGSDLAGGRDDDGAPVLGGGPFAAATAALTGLYDATQRTDDQVDIGYLEFTADGRFASYDYQQDDAGTGENCHLLGGPFPVTALGDDTFLVGSGEDATEIVVTRTPRGLVISEQRFVVLNGFPQFITVADEVPRVDAFTSAELPLCTFPEGESRS